MVKEKSLSKSRLSSHISRASYKHDDDLYEIVKKLSESTDEIILQNSKLEKQIKNVEKQNKQLIKKNNAMEEELENLYVEIEDIHDDLNEMDCRDDDSDNKSKKGSLEFIYNSKIKKKLLEKFNLTNKDIVVDGIVNSKKNNETTIQKQHNENTNETTIQKQHNENTNETTIQKHNENTNKKINKKRKFVDDDTNTSTNTSTNYKFPSDNIIKQIEKYNDTCSTKHRYNLRSRNVDSVDVDVDSIVDDNNDIDDNDDVTEDIPQIMTRNLKKRRMGNFNSLIKSLVKQANDMIGSDEIVDEEMIVDEQELQEPQLTDKEQTEEEHTEQEHTEQEHTKQEQAEEEPQLTDKEQRINSYHEHYNLSMDYCTVVEYKNINKECLDYFLDQNLEIKASLIIKEKQLKLLRNKSDCPKKYDIIGLDIDKKTKTYILENIDHLEMLEPDDSEYGKLLKWVNEASKLPFNKHVVPDLPRFNVDEINGQSIKKIQKPIYNYLKQSRDNMDKIIFGQEESKNRIIEILGKIIRCGNSGGNIFSVYGPPGVGKTSLIKEGLSKVLGLPFQLISLGGLYDSSYLKGSDYTYVGAVPGFIAKTLIKNQCMNPIFYFDELDKISATQKGQEIINTIIHLADKTQNNEFYDNYFGGIRLDLSKSIFVFSFNDEKTISSTLLDRMERIKMDGYTTEEKVKISMNYTIPRLYKEFNIKESELVIPEQTVRYIINTYGDTSSVVDYEYMHMNYKKSGVRKINHCLENIFNKLNVLLITGDSNDIIKYKENTNIKITKLPLVIDNDIIQKLIVSDKDNSNSAMHMYS